MYDAKKLQRLKPVLPALCMAGLKPALPRSPNSSRPPEFVTWVMLFRAGVGDLRSFRTTRGAEGQAFSPAEAASAEAGFWPLASLSGTD